MQSVSTAYKEEMSKTMRGQGYARITFNLIDTDADEDCKLSDNDNLFFSSLSNLAKTDRVPVQSYATFEKNRLKMNGKQLIPSRSNFIPQGYVSSILSNAECIYSKQPMITIDFTKTHKVGALTFVFDQSTEDYPAELKIIAYRNGVNLKEFTATGINNHSYILRESFIDFDKLEIIFVKSSKPFHRARIQQIVFGMGIVFDNTNLAEFTQSVEIDPIGRRLTSNSFDFSIINFNDMYNPDNPKGVWEAIEMQSPIKLEYGQRITNSNAIEWVLGGDYLLDARPEVSDRIVKFKCRDMVAFMNNTFYKGKFRPQGISLYDLAVEVLEDANLPILYEGSKPYVVDDALKNIYTVAPLPLKKQNECLQLIAHAARCVLFTDRKGIVRLEQNKDIQNDLLIDFNTALKKPKIDKLPTLNAVKTKVYSYNPKAGVEELHKSKRLLEGVDSFIVEYSSATDINVAVSGNATVTYNCYGSACEVALTGNGEVEIIITGRVLETSCSDVVVPVINADENGEVEILENILITNIIVAKELGIFVRDYLLLRNTYTLDYRGNPELETNDIIYMESQFDPRFKSRVLKHAVKFNGGLKGSLIMKRMM
ncbi:MAG: hypothetical protein WAX04_06615 [Oscillospiraceae bacterium]